MGYELQHEDNILKLNNFMFIGMLKIQLTSNQQAVGSSPPGIAILLGDSTPVCPRILPVSCVVDGLSVDRIGGLSLEIRGLE